MLSIRKYLKSVFYILLSEGFGDHDKYSGELLVLHISVTARRSGLGNEDLDKQETLKLPPALSWELILWLKRSQALH